MTRQYSRRAALGVLGVGLAGLTGAAAPRSCSVLSAVGDCDTALSLSGPERATLAADALDPRFVLANETDGKVRVTDAKWSLYRREGDWSEVASDRSSGASATLAPDGETAWTVLLRRDDTRYTSATTTSTSFTTRYVGPVSLTPGDHMFVVSGRADGERFESAVQFAVE